MTTLITEHYTELMFKDSCLDNTIRVQNDLSQISIEKIDNEGRDGHTEDFFIDTDRGTLTAFRDMLNHMLNENCVEESVKIADKSAIDFMSWVSYNCEVHEGLINYDGEDYTIDRVYEIYKEILLLRDNWTSQIDVNKLNINDLYDFVRIPNIIDKMFHNVPIYLDNDGKSKPPLGILKTYLMMDSLGFTKIGRSRNPHIREKTLQSHIPIIDLIAICDKDVERELHEKFKSFRGRGEWFKLTDAQIRKIIKDYPDDTPFGFRNQPMQELHEIKHPDKIFVTFQ